MAIPTTQSLAILINAKTGGLVTEVKSANDSLLDLATTEEREAVSAAALTAAKDKEAASLAKVTLEQAKQNGDPAAVTAAQGNYNNLVKQSNVSKAEAKAATDSLKVSELEAAAGTNTLATATGALGLVEEDAATASNLAAVAAERLTAAHAAAVEASEAAAAAQAKLDAANEAGAGAAGGAEAGAGAEEAQAGLAAAQQEVAATAAAEAEAEAEAATAADAATAAAARLAAAEAAEAGATDAATASTSLYGKALEAVGLSADTAGAAFGTAAGAIVPLVAAFGAFKVIDAGVSSFENLGNQIRLFQQLTGAGATQASLLVGQVNALGIAPDAAARAMQRLGSSIGDGSTKLGQFGIQVALNKQGTVDIAATFENLATAYQDSTNAAEKDAIVKQIGIRNGTQLVPLLNLTATQLQQINELTKSSGGIFSQDDVNNAFALKLSTSELSVAIKGVDRDLAQDFVPTLTAAANVLTGILDDYQKLDNIKLPGSGGSKGGFTLINPVKGIQDAIDAEQNLVDKKSEDAKASDKLKQSTLDLQSAQDANTSSTDNSTTSVDDLITATEGLVDAQKAVRDATNNLADDQQTLADAQSAYNTLLATGGVDIDKETSAYNSLVSASDSLSSALASQQQAQDALNKVEEKSTQLQLQQAQNKVDLAGDAIATAQAAKQSAGEALSKLLGSGQATAGEIAAAQADLKTKTDDVTASILAQSQAHVDLTTAQQKGTDADPAVVSAELTLAKSHDAVTTAYNNRASAYAKMQQAEQPAPGFNLELAKDALAVSRAQQAVADAQDNRTRAAVGLQEAENKLYAAVAGQAGALAEVQSDLDKLASQGYDVSALVTALGEATGSGIVAALGANGPNPVTGAGAIPDSSAPDLGPPGTGAGPGLPSDITSPNPNPQTGIAPSGSHPGNKLASMPVTVQQNFNVDVVSPASAASIANEMAFSVRTSVPPITNPNYRNQR